MELKTDNKMTPKDIYSLTKMFLGVLRRRKHQLKASFGFKTSDGKITVESPEVLDLTIEDFEQFKAVLEKYKGVTIQIDYDF